MPPARRYGVGGAVKEIHIGRHHNNALQIEVDASTADSVDAYVRYWPDSAGEAAALSSPSSPKGLEHRMVLLNLVPGTKYSYQVVAGGVATKTYGFASPVLPMWLQEQFKYSSDSLALIPQVFKEGFMLLNKRETPGVDYIVDYKGRIRWYHEAGRDGF
ncbi:fibronectin type III domain-containing protein [Puia sp. P3]|uniref:fibronectin type III domain-containing protein n=1 Tax=Puia sp. P3 TaxID=3423952 RepID=UPI003D6797E2